MKPDIVIPNMPKVVGHAANMGEAAMAVRGGFRNGMLALAREVAFVQLLDNSHPGAGTATKTGVMRRLLRRGK